MICAVSPTPAGASTVFREGFYLTYPHNNGFCQDGRGLVLGRLDGASASLWKTSLDANEETRVCRFDVAGEAEKLLWFDVAQNANRLVTVRDNGIWIYDLDRPGGGDCIYRAESPAQLLSLASITSDGRQVVATLRFPDRYAALSVEVETGKSRILFEQPWYANHFHFSPYDEAWIGFCHEGPCEQVGDRVWGWNAIHAPEGRCLFDQNFGNPARELCVGHERWCFHAPTALVVAYGVSPGGPRGTYEIFADGKSPRLVSRGDRHLHVNASRSGRWAVIDTSGPHDLPGRSWENANGISDILLLDAVSGGQLFLARTRLDSHPSHPHPVFSPDERFIFFNEATVPDKGNRVRVVENPWFAE